MLTEAECKARPPEKKQVRFADSGSINLLAITGAA
jgi:hypothetical protein